MGKIPAFQFYPADWLNDIKLQSCSLAAQGLLVNLMCIMHQADQYGKLIINGYAPSIKAVSNLLRLHHKTYQARLKELLLYGVLYEDDNGVVCCKRMIKDEYIREVRRESGKLGGNPLLKQKVKQGSKQKSTPSSSSSSSSSPSKKKIKKKDVFGEFKNVLLSKDELEKLNIKFGRSDTNDRIENLSEYIESKGVKYKSHYATILAWDRRNNNRPTGKQGILEPTTYAQGQDAERRRRDKWLKEQTSGQKANPEDGHLVRTNNT